MKKGANDDCPPFFGGTTGTVIEGGTLRYRASKIDCDVWPFKMQCCPARQRDMYPRDLHEDARDIARALAKTEALFAPSL